MRLSKKRQGSMSRARSLKPPPNPFSDAAAGRDPITAPVTAARRGVLDGLDSSQRKKFPLGTGLMDYFPDALAEVANLSWAGNEKHNPGQPLHHARGKSNDHADCIMRHFVQRGTFDVIVIDGKECLVRHSVCLAWRALAAAQEEIEKDLKLDLPRGAKET